MMHRDNPEIPVGEFVDVLNEHLKAGRFKAFGGSNWTKERVDAFNADAKKKGLTGMAATSNNLALAVMVDAVWAGCLTANQPEYLAWHEKLQMPIMPWSSQARGFFVLGDPANTSDKEMVRCWYSPDNFERLRRAKELSAKKGCTQIQLAMAWVLNQPFMTFPLIGPRQIDETRTSFEALKINLSRDEVKWLNLQS
jgi:aryl-alcohol dehydrogenase-like predicted oxidoreductase